MNEKQLLYITTIFNLDPTNSYILEDIELELKDIGFENFKNFYKGNSNYLGSEYKKGLEKFLFFTKLYRKLHTDTTKKVNYCRELAFKVKLVSSLILEHNADFYNFKIVGSDKCFFSENDIATLEKIGSLVYCARLQRSVSGSDALLEKMEELIDKKAQTPQYLQISKKETISPKTLSIIGRLKK